MGFITAFLIAFALLWVIFVNLMALKKAAENATGYQQGMLYAIGYPAFLVGYVYDVIFNITYGSIMFLEFPTQWTLTERMQYHIKYTHGYRRNLAIFICRYLVEPWDPGHCGLDRVGRKL